MLPDDIHLFVFNRNMFIKLHEKHWRIEQYHRVIKQICHIEHFQVRKQKAIRNHIFASICSYVRLQCLCITDLIVIVCREICLMKLSLPLYKILCLV